MSNSNLSLNCPAHLSCSFQRLKVENEEGPLAAQVLSLGLLVGQPRKVATLIINKSGPCLRGESAANTSLDK